MISIFRKIIGLVLILASIGGLVFSISGMFFVWLVEASVTQNIQTGVEAMSQALDTTAQGLAVTQEALLGSLASIQSVGATLETAGKTIDTTEPMLDEISNVLSEELPKTIRATQVSISTAQQSAGVVDTVLGALSFIPGISYNPGTSLSSALGGVSTSLKDLPQSFADMASSLEDTKHNLQTFRVDFSLMKDAIRQVETSMAQYESIIEGYHTSVTQVQTQLHRLDKNLPNLIRGITWGLTIFLIWMAIAQLGLFTQGWELLTRKSPKQQAQLDSVAQQGVKTEVISPPEIQFAEIEEHPSKPEDSSSEEPKS
jgi:hypothetical protein